MRNTQPPSKGQDFMLHDVRTSKSMSINHKPRKTALHIARFGTDILSYESAWSKMRDSVWRQKDTHITREWMNCCTWYSSDLYLTLYTHHPIQSLIFHFPCTLSFWILKHCLMATSALSVQVLKLSESSPQLKQSRTIKGKKIAIICAVLWW